MNSSSEPSKIGIEGAQHDSSVSFPPLLVQSPFLGLPAGELQGLHVSLRALWGAFARELRDRLLETPNVEKRFEILESALRSRLAANAIHPAVDFALQEFDGPAPRRVAGVAEKAGLSARRFIEVFRARVGLTPKMYCRVRRFQRVVGRGDIGPRIDWAAEAREAGYADQSHLIHDFRAIAGLSPGAWAKLRTAHRNHVPMP